MHFLVTTSKGIDQLLFNEVQRLCPDAALKQGVGRVEVHGEPADAYRVCLWSRLANRVIVVLHQDPVANQHDLYAQVQQIDWPSQFTSRDTFVVNFTGTSRELNNTQFSAQRVKDAIVDDFTENGEARPSVTKQDPDISVYGRLHHGQLTVGIDITGRSLHQRHYRLETGEAPIKEHVACALLHRAGVMRQLEANETVYLIDPMAGSGTIMIEAALAALNIAPALSRQHWGFDAWLKHDKSAWQHLRDEAFKAQRDNTDSVFVVSDSDTQVLKRAQANANNADVGHLIEFRRASVDELTLEMTTIPAGKTGTIISNPPYGERLGDVPSLLALFQRWGRHVKTHFADWRISLISANRDLLQQLRLRSHKHYGLNNGALECQVVNYVLDADNVVVKESNTDSAFANRLQKNLKKLKPFLKQLDSDCYRLYDADLPEYNVAIDRYGDYIIVQEYAAPKEIPEAKTKKRLNEVLLQLPIITEVASDKIVVKTRQKQRGKSQYRSMDSQNNRVMVFENNAKFFINPTDYLDVGLFLDHRDTRQLIKREAQGKRVLNLFCYTGSVSVHAAKGGASSVTSVDMSNTYLAWAKDNFRANNLRGAYDFIQADCQQWVSQTYNKHYDVIFVDPPSFSNSKRMDGTWDVQRDHVALLHDTLKLLAPGGTLYFSTNLRSFKMDVDALSQRMQCQDITGQTIPQDFERNRKIHQCWRVTHAAN